MAEDQPNDSPPPKPSLSGMWERMNQRIDNAPTRNIVGEDTTLPSELTQQEEMTQSSARKLATMANEIKDIVETGGAKSDWNNRFFVEVNNTSFDRGRIKISYFSADDIKDQTEDNILVCFTYSPNAKTDYGKKLGTEGNFELTISVHSDEKSREAYDEYLKNKPISVRDAYTRYYFDEEGNCAKVLELPKGMSDQRPLIGLAGEYTNSVEGEMTPSDFELAGKALSVILEKIRPQTPQSA